MDIYLLSNLIYSHFSIQEKGNILFNMTKMKDTLYGLHFAQIFLAALRNVQGGRVLKPW